MEYIEIVSKKCHNIQVHRYYFKSEDLRNLLDEIIQNCYYVIYGNFKVPYDAIVDCENTKIIEGAKLPNNEPLFIDIEKLYRFSSHSGLIHYENDSIGVVGKQVCIPQLAYIIKAILDNNQSGIEQFKNYMKSNELIDIDDKIARAGNNLDQLRELRDRRCNGQYFDIELLKKYYQRLCELITVGLVKEREEFEDPYANEKELGYVSFHETVGNEKRFYRYYYEKEAIVSLLEIMNRKIGSSQLACIINRIINDNDEEGIRELEIYPQRDEYSRDIFRRYYTAIKSFIYPRICVKRERTYSTNEGQEKLYKLFLQD